MYRTILQHIWLCVSVLFSSLDSGVFVAASLTRVGMQVYFSLMEFVISSWEFLGERVLLIVRKSLWTLWRIEKETECSSVVAALETPRGKSPLHLPFLLQATLNNWPAHVRGDHKRIARLPSQTPPWQTGNTYPPWIPSEGLTVHPPTTICKVCVYMLTIICFRPHPTKPGICLIKTRWNMISKRLVGFHIDNNVLVQKLNI